MVSLSAGQIAGIIVGIVVACLILLGLLLWRLITFRSNRDFFTGRQHNLPQKLQRQGGHIRSTRRQTFEAYSRDGQYDDDKHLVNGADQPYMDQHQDDTLAEHEVDLNDGAYGHGAPGHKAYDVDTPSQHIEPDAAYRTTAQGASPARRSRWWPYGQTGSVRDASSSRGQLPVRPSFDRLSRPGGSPMPGSRSMVAHDEDMTLPVDEQPEEFLDHDGPASAGHDTEDTVPDAPKRRSGIRNTYKQGCTTQ